MSNPDERLAAALEECGYEPRVVGLARAGHWSDFRSPLSMPKANLVSMLRGDGHTALAARVAEGEFDG